MGAFGAVPTSFFPLSGGKAPLLSPPTLVRQQFKGCFENPPVNTSIFFEMSLSLAQEESQPSPALGLLSLCLHLGQAHLM